MRHPIISMMSSPALPQFQVSETYLASKQEKSSVWNKSLHQTRDDFQHRLRVNESVKQKQSLVTRILKKHND